MSRENVELVRQMLEAWNRRDADAARTYLAPESNGSPPAPRRLNAPFTAATRRWPARRLRSWETWEVFRFEETEMRDLGGSLVWLGRVHMKGGASQVELDQEFGIYCLLRDGKVVRATACRSWTEALEAAGLRE